MIDPKSLRIGSIVCECPFTENPVWHHEVEGITQGYVSDTNSWECFVHLDNGDIFNIKDISPIPLSEQWLLKAGFECLEKDVSGALFYHTKCRWIQVLFTGGVFKYGAITSIKHLHTLQNIIFDLSGEELHFDFAQ